MPFRIRMRAAGELEVEVDTPSEVQDLLRVALPPWAPAKGGRLALPPGPPVVDAVPAPSRRRRVSRRGQRGVARRVAVRAPREAPPVSPSSSTDAEAMLLR